MIFTYKSLEDQQSAEADKSNAEAILSGNCTVFTKLPGTLYKIQHGDKGQISMEKFTEDNQPAGDLDFADGIRMTVNYPGMSTYVRLEAGKPVVTDITRTFKGHIRVLDFEQITDMCASLNIPFQKPVQTLKAPQMSDFETLKCDDTTVVLKNYNWMATTEILAWVEISTGDKNEAF